MHLSYRGHLKPGIPKFPADLDISSVVLDFRDDFDYENPCPSNSFAPHRVFNIGCGRPVSLMRFIELLEKEFNLVAKKNFLPLQAGDVEATWADTTLLNEWIDFVPRISIEEGIHQFANWFKSYYL